MERSDSSPVEVIDVAPGLWIWRLRHWEWRPGMDWDPIVTCTYVESGGERLVLDPLEPPSGAHEVWRRLDAKPPNAAVFLKPDHTSRLWSSASPQDIGTLVPRYGCRCFLPDPARMEEASWQHEVMTKHVTLEYVPIGPGDALPGGLLALDEGRGRYETPLWLPEQRAVVFADALTERGGELRVWNSTFHQERVIPALRSMLNLPFERVIISHGQPVHTREAFERAMTLPAWP